MQNSPLTRWLWRRWQHEETGRVVLLPLWKNPGRRWYVVGWPWRGQQGLFDVPESALSSEENGNVDK